MRAGRFKPPWIGETQSPRPEELCAPPAQTTIRAGAKPANATISDDEFVAGCLRGGRPPGMVWSIATPALIYSIPLKYGFNEADAADVFQRCA